MKKSKLPPYIELAMIKIREGIYDEMESTTEIILNNILKSYPTRNKRISKWSESMNDYWRRVLIVWIENVKASSKLSKTDKKVFLEFIEMRLKNGEQGKSN